MKRILGRTIRLLTGSLLAAGTVVSLVVLWRGPVGAEGVAASLRSLLGGMGAAWFAALVVLTALAWRLTVALSRARVGGQRGPEGGTAVIEFAMLFPILVLVMMIMVQLALLMHGNLMVNYAAYAAARSAVVQIPRDFGGVGEPRNVLVNDPLGSKMQRIRRAAVLAVTPVSGRVPPAGDASAIQGNLQLVYDNIGEAARAGLRDAFARKFTYADERTRITQIAEHDGVQWRLPATFGANRAVRVVIQHDLELGVPFARAIFADGSFQDANGETHYYTTVEAQYKLTNEGARTEPLEPYCPRPPPPPPGPPQPPPQPYHP